MLRIIFPKKSSTGSLYQSQLKAYYILLHPKKLRNLLKPWLTETLIGSKSTCPTVLHLSFLFHNNNSVTINKLIKWITIPPVSKMGIFHTLALNFMDWPFRVIVTRHFRPKSGHLNEIVYCKRIDRTLKNVIHWRSGSFLRQIIPALWKLLVFG